MKISESIFIVVLVLIFGILASSCSLILDKFIDRALILMSCVIVVSYSIGTAILMVIIYVELSTATNIILEMADARL